MRQDVKDLANAMERGWKMVPKMQTGYMFHRNADSKIDACCAMGHAILGAAKIHKIKIADVKGNMMDHMHPILNKQKVYHSSGSERTLWWAISDLNDYYKWTTPQIVAWLRTHIND